MRKTQVIINNPCSQSWDNMVPDAKGRFCDLCQLSVIDFSTKTPEEIRTYLSCHSGERVCGRFKSSNVVAGRPFYGSLVSKVAGYASILMLGLLIITGCKTRKHTKYTTGAPRWTDETPSR
jgi:hypothetical protein